MFWKSEISTYLSFCAAMAAMEHAFMQSSPNIHSNKSFSERCYVHTWLVVIYVWDHGVLELLLILNLSHLKCVTWLQRLAKFLVLLHIGCPVLRRNKSTISCWRAMLLAWSQFYTCLTIRWLMPSHSFKFNPLWRSCEISFSLSSFSFKICRLTFDEDYFLDTLSKVFSGCCSRTKLCN